MGPSSEAQLQRADLLILGGLNEGVWPPETESDPWLSRPMRAAFGLPAPERRIGIAAHDFAQGLGAREVWLTRAVRAEGTPTVASRWLLRLDALLRAAGSPGRNRGRRRAASSGRGSPTKAERADRIVRSLRRNRGPPVAARPRQPYGHGDRGTWMRDPYAI